MKKAFNHKIKNLLRALILFPLAMGSQHLFAEQKSLTLDHIKSSSTLNIGYRQLEPFSFKDADGKVIGYTISLCNMIADELRLSLGMKKLDVRYIPIMFTERISALNSSKIDMDCSVNTIAPERVNSVAFSRAYYASYMHVIALRANNIHSINDLKGRTISMPRGSKVLLELNRINRENKLNLSIITSDTAESAFEMMSQNRTAGLIIDDIVAYQFINKSENPEDFTISHDVVGEKMQYAIMMRKQDPQFVTFVDNKLGKIFASPAHAQLSSKWLTQKAISKNTPKY